MTVRRLGLRTFQSAAPSSAVGSHSGVRLAKLLAVAVPDGLWVELAPQTQRVHARLGFACDVGHLERAIERGQAAVLAFEEGDSERPIVLGIVSPLLPAPTDAPTTSLVVEADADGRRVRLEAQEEVVLQCGLSSITLKCSGKVVIRGTYIETYASGTNRIKGGNVRIN